MTLLLLLQFTLNIYNVKPAYTTKSQDKISVCAQLMIYIFSTLDIWGINGLTLALRSNIEQNDKTPINYSQHITFFVQNSNN